MSCGKVFHEEVLVLGSGFATDDDYESAQRKKRGRGGPNVAKRDIPALQQADDQQHQERYK